MQTWDAASYRFRRPALPEESAATEALRHSADRYRLLFESIDQGFCVVQLLFDAGKPVDYRFLEINPAFESQSGLSNALGKRILELAPSMEDHWFQIYGDVAMTGDAVRFEHHAEALHRWFDVYASRVGEPADAMVAILFSDITQRYELEAQREQLLAAERAARSAAETATRLKDEFLATLSHELRTPLSVIIGWSQLLLKRADPADEQQRKGLLTIVQSARTQATLISDMLDMSAIFLGKVKLDVEPLDGFEQVAQVIQSSDLTIIQAKGIHLEFQPSSEVCLLLADPVRLQQILWNLLSNAIKFTPSGGHISVSARRRGSRFEVVVADTGVGIEPAFLPNLFDQFRQADGSTSRRYGGLGLGLSIVQQLVEMHSGTVLAESEGLGHGATFTVDLPVYEAALVAEPSGQIHPDILGQVQSESLVGYRILAVEDQPDMLEYLTRVLEEYGAEVVPAASAHEALAILAADAEKFSTLVADVGMPDMDGYQMLDSIRSHMGIGAEVLRAVAVTALAREDDRKRALASGFQAHLAKPYQVALLIAAIRGINDGPVQG